MQRWRKRKSKTHEEVLIEGTSPPLVIDTNRIRTGSLRSDIGDEPEAILTIDSYPGRGKQRIAGRIRGEVVTCVKTFPPKSEAIPVDITVEVGRIVRYPRLAVTNVKELVGPRKRETLWGLLTLQITGK